MSRTMNRCQYRAFGLLIEADFDLPELLPAEPMETSDIRVTLAGSEREAWLAKMPMRPGQFVPLPCGGFLLDIPEVALFRVADGCSIEVAPAADADPGMIRLFTIGSALGMALHQRGILVLHGATVARDGKARVIVGDSGAGKSTLAARLGQAGCTVLGDDTIAVFPAPQDAAGHWVWPGSRVFKLWHDAIDDLGLATGDLLRIGNREDKFYAPNPGQADDAAVPCALVEILALQSCDAAPRVAPVDGIRALRTIAQNTYRPEYVAPLGREAAHFRQCAALSRDVLVSRLNRPWGAEHFDAVTDAVLARWGPGAAWKAS